LFSGCVKKYESSSYEANFCFVRGFNGAYEIKIIDNIKYINCCKYNGFTNYADCETFELEKSKPKIEKCPIYYEEGLKTCRLYEWEKIEEVKILPKYVRLSNGTMINITMNYTRDDNKHAHYITINNQEYIRLYPLTKSGHNYYQCY